MNETVNTCIFLDINTHAIINYNNVYLIIKYDMCLRMDKGKARKWWLTAQPGQC
jgi:hypothetical protein